MAFVFGRWWVDEQRGWPPGERPRRSSLWYLVLSSTPIPDIVGVGARVSHALGRRPATSCRFSVFLGTHYSFLPVYSSFLLLTYSQPLSPCPTPTCDLWKYHGSSLETFLMQTIWYTINATTVRSPEWCLDGFCLIGWWFSL